MGPWGQKTGAIPFPGIGSHICSNHRAGPAARTSNFWYCEKWDEEIEIDSQAGKLDFLIEEAKEEKEQGKLRDL